MGPNAGRNVALLDQHNEGADPDESAPCADAGELYVVSSYFGISGMHSGVLILVTIHTYIHGCSVISTLRVNPL